MIDLSTEKVLDELFTMNFSIDQDLGVYNLTPRLRRYLGDFEDGQNLFDVFKFHRPSEVNSLKDLRRIGSSLVLLLSTSGGHGLRGQLLPLSEVKGYRFVGVPWLAWIDANNFESSLNQGDFPKIDSQMDQQIYISTQKSMVGDLEELNRGLISAQSESIEENRVRSDFFAVMSHEMRTPLNGVISALSLLEDGDQNDKEKLTSLAKNSADNLMTVINYALDYSKIEAGQMPLESTNFRLDDLVGYATDVVVSRAQMKSIEIQTTIDAEVPLHLKGDSKKLRQILINLLANGIKFTEKGSVKLKVGVVD
jgi:signal transduction histidine kinase